MTRFRNSLLITLPPILKILVRLSDRVFTFRNRLVIKDSFLHLIKLFFICKYRHRIATALRMPTFEYKVLRVCKTTKEKQLKNCKIEPTNQELRIYSYEPRKRSERLFSVLREKVTYCDFFSAQQGVLSRTEGFPLRSTHSLSGIGVFLFIGSVSSYDREHTRNNFSPYDVQDAHRVFPLGLPTLIVIPVFSG